MDKRVLAAKLKSLESQKAGTGTNEAGRSGESSAPPATLTQQRPKVAVPALSPLLRPETLHTEKFLSVFEGQERDDWSKNLTFTPEYHPDKIDVPFPYPGDSNGRMEQNDVDVVVRGLRAKGGHAQARGVLENWLALGEKYTALPGTNQLNDLGRAGMPRLSSLLLEEANRHEDPEFLQRSYQVIADDHKHSWSDGYFKQSKNGLNRFCDVDYSHDATLEESGGAKNKARYDGDPMPFNPVDLNAHLYRTERDLQSMALKMAVRTKDSSWTKKAKEWGDKASQRKATILDKMWDEKSGLFHDLKVADGQRSQVKTLASLAVLEAGLLDPNNPKEMAMATRLASSTRQFLQPDGTAVWDRKADTPAQSRDLLGFAQGLEKYGFKAEAQKLNHAAKLALSSDDTSTVGLSTRALLEAPTTPAKESEEGLEAWVSPKGLSRLRQAAGNLGQTETPKVNVREASALDRRLRQMDKSLVSLPVIRELKEKGLDKVFLGIDFDNGEVKPAQPQELRYQPLEGDSLKLGSTELALNMPGIEAAKLGENAFKLRRNGQELNVTKTDDHLVFGDKAYGLDQFTDPEKVDIPKDILGAFHMAGGNPQLESFYHANRDWISIKTGPRSEVNGVEGRPGWTKLYNKIGENWKPLTIEPSVKDHDTAMQYFNPAAVPSLGIFKTQFNWDTMFMAKGMQLQGQEETVSGMTDNLLYLLKSTGRVPNAARSVYLNKSQPPFLPSLVRMSEPIRKRTFGDKATEKWVKEAYDVMSSDFHDFWREDGGRNVGEINGEKVHLSRWGGPNHKFAMDESGFDTTSRFYGKTMDLAPPDLNAFLWGYSRDMEAIALRLRDKAQEEGNQKDFLKYSSEGAFWGNEAKQIKHDVIKHCWDEESGMFRDYRFQGENQGLQKDEDALSAVVAPLWVGMLDPNDPKEKEMIERSLDNISLFEKDHGLAATAEDYGHPEMQWNGPSGWAPLHMMAIESEVQFGRHDAAARHTQKWLDTIDKVHSEDGIILERYDVVKGGHPPVQKGRYEETQGEGPGFGWTNATVPWAMIEVVGGVRLHRDAGVPTRMDIIPHLPEGTQQGPVSMKFTNPGSAHEWEVTHDYKKDQESYRFNLDGNFDAVPELVLETPPLPRGKRPVKGENCPPYSIKEKPGKDGLVRYQVHFEGLSGQQRVDLNFV
ncbi:MAG TPA: hypothetical protein EYO33_02455 [Phycisphaerales bacterium]|nr:hypothetical protein [Phycisphaerales bacterium]